MSLRRDVFEVIQLLEEENHIKLCLYRVNGFTRVEHTVEMTFEEIQKALGKKIKIVE